MRRHPRSFSKNHLSSQSGVKHTSNDVISKNVLSARPTKLSADERNLLTRCVETVWPSVQVASTFMAIVGLMTV